MTELDETLPVSSPPQVEVEVGLENSTNQVNGASEKSPITSTPSLNTTEASIFGETNTDGPLWFRKEAFIATEFTPEEYVTDLRRYVPLETLRDQLSKHLSSLNNELVELINKDYTDFVSLSTKLVDVDGAVVRMRAPLLDLRSKLQHTREDTFKALQVMEGRLGERQESRSIRAVLELMLDTTNVQAKVEKLVLELRSAETSRLGAEAEARLIERVASELNRLNFYIQRAQGLPFVESMMPRIRSSEDELTLRLHDTLRNALQNQNEVVTLHCLLAYAAMDKVEAGELAVREVLVAPAVQRLLTQTDSNTEPPFLLKQMLDAIQTSSSFLLSLVASQPAGLHVFNFLSNSILAEVDSALSASRAHMFSAGVPATFLKNFTAALRFVESLESGLPTPQALTAFRSSQPLHDFMSRWNLQLYFTLRFQEIAGVLDEGLGGSAIARHQGSGEKGGAQFLLTITDIVWDCLQKCWANEVFLPGLADRFLRLSLQLLSRYRGWLSAGVASRTGGQHTASASPGAPAQSTNEGILAGASAEDLIVVWSDVEKLTDLVEGEYTATVELTLAHLPSSAIAGVRDAFMESAGSLQKVLPELESLFTTAVVEKCVEVLKQMRGITATYRMTNKPLPTRHSHFLPSVLAPLKAITAGGDKGVPKGSLSAETWTRLVGAVVAQVTEKYLGMAQDLVSTVRKTESSLKRLKGRRGETKGDKGEGAKGSSDTDKICHQLLLDVQEYGRQLEQLGVDTSSLEDYAKLCAIVNPEQGTDPGASADHAGKGQA